MRYFYVLILICPMAFLSAQKNSELTNPFFQAFATPYEAPPFDLIREEHFLPAIKEGIRLQTEAITAIRNQKEKPGFVNTIEALESSSRFLDRVTSVFYNLTGANTNTKLQEIAKEAAPLLSAARDNIVLDAALFERIKIVYNQRATLNLTTEQRKLLEDTYKGFVRGGANLPATQQEEIRKVNQELSLLSLRFGDNILAETNEFKLFITSPADLSGLPQPLIDAAAAAAEKAGAKGQWLFTLHNPSVMPFLSYADNRELRRKIMLAYLNRGNNDNQYDNKKILSDISRLRAKKARMLGYQSHAAYVLEESMAKTPAKVYELLDQLWAAALPIAEREAAELQEMISRSGDTFALESWDWRYYAEKLRKEKYDLDDEALRPYFEIESVKKGMFQVIERLYGVKFARISNVPVYHEEVEAYAVTEADGRSIGLLYMDLFPRTSKRAGGWMSSFRKQHRDGSRQVQPIITIVCNFTRPAGDQPALLTTDEVNTLYHEVGHALHGLLSNVTYSRLSGTSVPRDFVELPSQIMENWAMDPAWLKEYARHYQTGETIPDELISRMKESRHFNTGFTSAEYLAASFLDMDYHTAESEGDMDATAVEQRVAQRLSLPAQIPYRYRSTYFNHIFGGGYAAGYYSYIWSEVLDADAYAAFQEQGLFDKELSSKFRKFILETGGSQDPMELYKQFRGREPEIGPLLERRGLVKP